jgi:tripartite-type tricarboxylate transporter receptor subunit TctC
MNRTRTLLGFICLVFAVVFIQPSMVSSAEMYPTKPVKLIVTFPAGGPTDICARKLADLAGPHLGQPVVVENRAGAGGVVGLRFVLKSKPDGYMICNLTASPIVIAPHFSEVDYNPLTDITAIVGYAYSPQPLAVPVESPIKTFKDFIEEARKRELTIAGSGRIAADISMERLAAKEKWRIKMVPMGGTAACLQAVLGGHTDAMLNSGIYEYVRSGKLRLLCLTTGRKSKEFPEIPTLKELGYDVDVPAFYGIIAPKGLPEHMRKKLEEAFTQAAGDPSFAPAVEKASWEFVFWNGEDFGNHIKEMYKRSEKDCREAGLGKYGNEKK